MTVWLVRAGKHGENEELALDNECVIIGWGQLGDLSAFDIREKLANALAAAYPGSKPNTLRNWESQIWPIRSTINKGDVVVLRRRRHRRAGTLRTAARDSARRGASEAILDARAG